jgi:hypothetical protein
MLELLILGFVVLSVICLWILIERRKEPKFLIWFIPSLLLLISSTYVTYDTLLGYAKFGQPKKAIHISHWVDEPSMIYLWVLEDNTKPRAYRFKYTRAMHDALQGVDKMRRQGKHIVIEEADENIEGYEGDEVEGDKAKKTFTLGGGLEYYDWDHLHELPRKQ